MITVMPDVMESVLDYNRNILYIKKEQVLKRMSFLEDSVIYISDERLSNIYSARLIYSELEFFLNQLEKCSLIDLQRVSAKLEDIYALLY